MIVCLTICYTCSMTPSSVEQNQENIAHVLTSDLVADTEHAYAVFEIPELPGWNAVLLLADTDNVPDLVELRIVRGDVDSLIDKNNSVHSLGLKTGGPVDNAEITSKVLRRIPVERLIRLAQKGIRPEISDLPWRQWVSTNRSRLGKGGRPDIDYAIDAQHYVFMVTSGSPQPMADLAKKFNVSASQMRFRIGEARKRGLLTNPKRGRAGGDLTDLAKQILLDRLATREEES